MTSNFNSRSHDLTEFHGYRRVCQGISAVIVRLGKYGYRKCETRKVVHAYSLATSDNPASMGQMNISTHFNISRHDTEIINDREIVYRDIFGNVQARTPAYQNIPSQFPELHCFKLF